jgi:hypothetical protein
MSGGIGNFIVTLPENMDISSDAEDFNLEIWELFDLQPIGASRKTSFVPVLMHRNQN